MRPDNQITGNVGLFYCCYMLSKQGWNVMPTTRNARGIDTLVYNHDGSCFHSIQVKTLSRRNAVPLGNSLERIMGEYWIIVNNVTTTSPSVFILSKDEIKKGAKKNGEAYWLQPRVYEQEAFHEKWDRIWEKDGVSTCGVSLMNPLEMAVRQ